MKNIKKLKNLNKYNLRKILKSMNDSDFIPLISELVFYKNYNTNLNDTFLLGTLQYEKVSNESELNKLEDDIKNIKLEFENKSLSNYSVIHFLNFCRIKDVDKNLCMKCVSFECECSKKKQKDYVKNKIKEYVNFFTKDIIVDDIMYFFESEF